MDPKNQPKEVKNPTYQETEKARKLEAAKNAKVNAMFRNPRKSRRLTQIVPNKVGKDSQIMNAFIRGEPEPTPSFTEADLEREIQALARKEQKARTAAANAQIRAKLAAAAGKNIPEGNAGSGTGSHNTYKKPATMNDAIREIMDLRKKLGYPGP